MEIVAAWWAAPGASEFASAVVGAIVGSVGGGLVSWALQRQAWRQQKLDRADDKKASDRAHLLGLLYEVMQAADDLHKNAEQVAEAHDRLPKLQAPQIAGLTWEWQALFPQATLPEWRPVAPEALTVFMDHSRGDLAIKALDVSGIHDNAIKLWRAFGESKGRMAEKVAVQLDGETTYTEVTGAELPKLYPHLKQLTDLGQGVCARVNEHAQLAKDFAKELAVFITEVSGKRVTIEFPAASHEKSRASDGEAQT